MKNKYLIIIPVFILMVVVAPRCVWAKEKIVLPKATAMVVNTKLVDFNQKVIYWPLKMAKMEGKVISTSKKQLPKESVAKLKQTAVKLNKSSP
jgi:hypothetical protein